MSGSSDDPRVLLQTLCDSVGRVLSATQAILKEQQNEGRAERKATAASVEELKAQLAGVKELLDAFEGRLGPQVSERKSEVTTLDDIQRSLNRMEAAIASGFAAVSGSETVPITENHDAPGDESERRGSVSPGAGPSVPSTGATGPAIRLSAESSLFGRASKVARRWLAKVAENARFLVTFILAFSVIGFLVVWGTTWLFFSFPPPTPSHRDVPVQELKKRVRAECHATIPVNNKWDEGERQRIAGQLASCERQWAESVARALHEGETKARKLLSIIEATPAPSPSLTRGASEESPAPATRTPSADPTIGRPSGGACDELPVPPSASHAKFVQACIRKLCGVEIGVDGKPGPQTVDAIEKCEGPTDPALFRRIAQLHSDGRLTKGLRCDEPEDRSVTVEWFESCPK